MKIYAYELTLEVLNHFSELPYHFSLLDWNYFIEKLNENTFSEGKIFYIQGEPTPQFAKEIFLFQSDVKWRNSGFYVKILFPNEADKLTFITLFVALFKLKYAAGGLIQNEKGEYLFIRSRGKWTFPKGHLEKDLSELPDKTAIREVQEETGIMSPTIDYQLNTTYHSYMEKEKWRLKVTYWYKMRASSDEKLVPQTEEGITEIQWISKNDWLSKGYKAYNLNEATLKEDWIKD